MKPSMRNRIWTGGMVVAAGAVALACVASVGGRRSIAAEPPPRPIEFNRDVRPILASKCLACHGYDAKRRKAELRLDVPEGAFAVRKSGQAVVPGDFAKSLLSSRINTSDPDEVMPPPASHKTLSAAEKQTLQRWIAEGAKYQRHWSFEPIVKPGVPGGDVAGRNPVDAFLNARLKQEGLAAAAEADRPTLIRRAAFALTGLPPTVAETDAFVADGAPGAYERMVDRYLASPRFGEEMARYWLDLARYADTHGMHFDNERETWAYRDYVIDSFNQNKPFSDFVTEQLAGDQLPAAAAPHPTPAQLVATGFSRCNVTSNEGGSIDTELLYRYAVDRTSTAANVFMGLTAGCAVCHDHKFDPISAKEFYSLYAFFYSNSDGAFDGNSLLTEPVVRLPKDEQNRKLAEMDKQIADASGQLDQKTASISYVDPAAAATHPAVVESENVWLDDDFPRGTRPLAGPGQPTHWVTAKDGAPIFSGDRSLKRTDKGLAQDYFEGGARFAIPAAARIFAYVHMDPADPPKALMLQFFKDGWKHRGVWGDYDAIQWGAANTYERVNLGTLPAAGGWQRLEFPVEKLGLQTGDQVTGFAFTQFGGTVYWDKMGVVGRSDPTADPTHSFTAWRKLGAGKDTPGMPPDLNELLKAGPAKTTGAPEIDRLRRYYLQYVCTESRPQLQASADHVSTLRKEREGLEKSIPGSFVFKDLPSPRQAFVMMRGQYDKPGDKVEPGTPAALPPLVKAKPDGRATRLDLARWLVSSEHPLTARVEVNRLWQQFFGTGIVKTSGDFGSQGEPPSHPELLDWLAATFRESGWDVKKTVRLLVTSDAFRRSSVATPELLTRDPENRLYARGPRFRLDAEQIRDNALFVSGLISLDVGGKGVRPYQPANIWEPVGFVGSNTREFRQDTGSALYRRSIYTFLKRTAMAPFMANFDAPNRESSCPRRERSDTPLQALQLMNDVQHVEAARMLAQRMIAEGGATPATRIAYAWRTVLARNPEPDEAQIAQTELTAHLARYANDEAAARKLIANGEAKPDAKIAPGELAAYTLMASTIMNLDETVTRN